MDQSLLGHSNESSSVGVVVLKVMLKDSMFMIYPWIVFLAMTFRYKVGWCWCGHSFSPASIIAPHKGEDLRYVTDIRLDNGYALTTRHMTTY